MNEIKNDLNDSWSSNSLFLRENHFQEDEVNKDSEFWKCPIFVGSLQNFGDSLEKNKYVGLISGQNWSFSWMLKILIQS